MATLQKFKFLATQCAVVAGSPTRSPTTSPVIHLRRRKTLRMLLSRGGNNSGRHRRFQLHEDPDDDHSSPDRDTGIGNTNRSTTTQQVENKRRENQLRLGVRHKLKDLFVSSPPIDRDGTDSNNSKTEEVRGLLPPSCDGGNTGGCNGGTAVRRVGNGNLRPLSATLRQRLLRRAWRPVLVAIPEQLSP